MSDATYDVVGIGNALVDVLSHEDDEFIDAQDMQRGAMTLIDAERAEELYEAMGPAVEVSGGSAANTIAGVGSFGGRAAFIGKVFDDQLGAVFAHDLRAGGVEYRTPPATDGPPTGRCLIVVTRDAQRTMNTFLGASVFLGPDDVDAGLIEAGAVTYLEGYLFDHDAARAAYWKASEISQAAGRQVALTLSDTFCVLRHRDEWLDLVRHRVDVLFANEDEATALYQCDLDQAIERVRDEVAIGCVTMGASGSVIVSGADTVEVPAEPVELVVDTTGAGDLYAAGVLYGLAQGLDLATCGRYGSVGAAEVISHMGPRPETPISELIGR